MAVDGKGEVGIARGGDKAEAITRPTIDGDHRQRSQRAVKIATLTVNEGRVGGGYQSSRWSRDVVPVGESDDSCFVIDVVPTHDKYRAL